MLFFINKSILLSISVIIQLFLSLFIWQENNNLNYIILFNLIFFIAIPFSSALSAFLSDKIDPKISLLISVFLQILQITYTIYNAQLLYTFNIILIAIIGGLAEGFRGVAFNNVYNKVRPNSTKEHIYSENYLITQLTELIIPLSFAYIISYTGSYLLIFRILIVLLLITSILLVLQKSKSETNKFNLSQILNFPGTNKEKRTLASSEFLEGLTEGITLTLLPIIILSFSGSILNWGIIKTFFIIIAIAIGAIFDFYVNSHSSKIIYSVGALIFAACNIFLFLDINIYLILIFLLAKTLMDVIREVSYNASVRRISELDSNIENLQSEYEFFQDFFTNLGRVTMLLAVYSLSFIVSQELSMKFLLLVIGLMPLFTLSILGRSIIFKNGIQKISLLNKLTKIKIEKVENTPSSFLVQHPHRFEKLIEQTEEQRDLLNEDEPIELPTLGAPQN